MMAWLRTAVALIGFGFAIVQYSSACSRCPEPAPPIFHRAGISGARADFVRRPGACHFDLAVLVDGSLSVGRTVRADRRDDKGGMQSPVMAVAILLIFIGLFAFFAVLLRLT